MKYISLHISMCMLYVYTNTEVLRERDREREREREKATLILYSSCNINSLLITETKTIKSPVENLSREMSFFNDSLLNNDVNYISLLSSMSMLNL